LRQGSVLRDVLAHSALGGRRLSVVGLPDSECPATEHHECNGSRAGQGVSDAVPSLTLAPPPLDPRLRRMVRPSGSWGAAEWIDRRRGCRPGVWCGRRTATPHAVLRSARALRHPSASLRALPCWPAVSRRAAIVAVPNITPGPTTILRRNQWCVAAPMFGRTAGLARRISASGWEALTPSTSPESPQVVPEPMASPAHQRSRLGRRAWHRRCLS